ncbi:3-dehydroquinate synthase [Streptomonospora nanhaiensis]|uniref:3-dehydroquinate synthase n=1 Tax=Streptomonospora nanhaiensis TaxID=1323731 RepID=A0A853BJW9_9ACTN|nr:3-dehydroquinate synthase [Streptomonospora nanhaiensis]MBV2362478.1 3-dehydroquinate synthase [Streptomonospora nanhaiensis]MBX9389060.1 3-dehydroquinate synthase [Streptomonospora nanhaiensis]NYI94861.1 3-dehydroquinate synthase [Streptomonospora nanhaiensis]
MTATRIGVGGTSAPYDVVVGTGVFAELPDLVGGRAEQVAVIHPEHLGELARPALGALEAAGYTAHALPVPDGEAAKTAEVAASLWARLGQAGFTRTDAVVGVGGGAVTDLAGFVAATWLRGVRAVLVPTTLLGMVDAAVGGKTGINTAEGKNLVGAFHPPAGVLCDLATLPSLPTADYIGGLAEIIKAGFIADPAILDLVEADPEGATRPEGRHTRELIERAIAVKAEVVSSDLRESGRREILNYGHTLGHAIERAENYTFRHGYAVAIGMVFAAELARLDGRIDSALVRRHRDILAAVGLPTGYAAAAWPGLHEAMRVDKKARGATLRFIVLDSLAAPAVLTGPSADLLGAAYAAIST